MKRNLLKKIIAVALSATLLISASVTVLAATSDENSVGMELDYSKDYTKKHIETLFMIIPIGGKYTPESSERCNKAIIYANEVLDNDEATQEEINTAYIDLYEAITALEACNLDEVKLRKYCTYGNEIYENYYNYFSKESMSDLSDALFDARMALYYENTQEGIDTETAELAQTLSSLVITQENPDIVLFDEYRQVCAYTETYMEEYISDESTYWYSMPEFIYFDGYRLVSAYYNIPNPPMAYSMRTDKYIVESKSYNTPSGLGYLAVNAGTGDIITLEDALESATIDADELFESYSDYNYKLDMYVIGDTNYDGKVNIADATLVQKTVVGLAQEDRKNLEQDSPFDYNGDGVVNVTDATAIQKSLIS